jgi:cell fate (sporulation/competence/biofilm development) regulator YlbF (YheA/YmcA/DUF963 family)
MKGVFRPALTLKWYHATQHQLKSAQKHSEIYWRVRNKERTIDQSSLNKSKLQSYDRTKKRKYTK